MELSRQSEAALSLRRIKLLHTVVWFVLGSFVLAIPLLVALGHQRIAVALIAIVAIEVVVLLLNRFRCPLTDVAAQYTDDRRDNFDIYLPLWLARYNKQIFGVLYVAGILYALLAWWGAAPGWSNTI